MNRSDDSLKFKHHVRYGSTLRVIMDFSDLNESYFSIPTGQSGHFLSKNYADFLELWQRNDYVKIPLSNTSEIKEKKYMMLITNSSN